MTEAVTGGSVLLMGAPGSGKSFSLHTLLKEGLEVFVLATEPGAMETVLDACMKNNVPTAKLHWSYISPAAPGWKNLSAMASQINLLGYEDLTKLKSGINKSSSNQVMKLIAALENFKCDHCGKEFGDCATWGVDRALVLDSLSGLNLLAMSNTIGLKPAAHQGEWGVAMNFEEQIIHGLVSGLTCFFILTAHVDRDQDLLTGGTILAPAALGRKLGPKLGRFFSEVVFSRRKGTSFSWSTADVSADLKNRSLPIADELQPTFKPIVDAMKRRQSQVAVASPPLDEPKPGSVKP